MHGESGCAILSQLESDDEHGKRAF
jgi:hypothetical protein